MFIWFIAVCLIAEGLLNCVIILMLSRFLRKSGKGNFDVTEHMNTPFDKAENARTSQAIGMDTQKTPEIIDASDKKHGSKK